MSDLAERLRILADQIAKGGRPTHPYQEGLREAATRIEELEHQAAEDIIWMSGIADIPSEGLKAWAEIQDRWLR